MSPSDERVFVLRLALQAYNKSNGKIEVVTTKDQDPVLAPHVPIIGIDIWEHAYVPLMARVCSIVSHSLMS